MILYTHYCPINVFFVPASYWFHYVRGGSTCKHLRWCFFVTIAIVNIVFCWPIVIARSVSPMSFKFCCVSSLLSASRYRWFHLVPGDSSSLQVVPACFSSFPVLVYTWSLMIFWPPKFLLKMESVMNEPYLFYKNFEMTMIWYNYKINN